MPSNSQNAFVVHLLRVCEANPDAEALRGVLGGVVSYRDISETIAFFSERSRGGIAVVSADSGLPSILGYLAAIAAYDAVVLIGVSESSKLAEVVDLWRPSIVFSSSPVDLSGYVDQGIPSRPWWPHSSISVTECDEVFDGPQGQLLLGTSGSTGGVKFVRLSGSNLLANAIAISSALNMDSSDRVATILPITYSYGLSVLNSTLAIGGAILAGPIDFMKTTTKMNLEDFGVTQMQGVPSSYDLYERFGILDNPPSTVKLFTQAGGKMPAHLALSRANTLSRNSVGLSLMYGQTEATARMAILPPELVFDFPHKAGFAVPGSHFTDDGEDGELVFHGPNVMLGYASSPLDLARGDEMLGSLKTGDVGFLEDGLVEITGRLKRIGKIEGVRYSLDYLEATFSRIASCTVIEGSGQLHIFTNGADVSSSGLLALEPRLRERNIKIWHDFDVPLLSSGKPDYQWLTKFVSES